MANKILKNETPELGQPLTAELLGRAIRARRTQSGLRLEDTAALCGVAKQTLQNIEKGTGKSKLETILQICKGLGIKLNKKHAQSRYFSGESSMLQACLGFKHSFRLFYLFK
ncbi:MAG: helix-turn-helix transcriptional regulator [Francisellaceae bacterium]|nr:helix-turn-helix transcriptional regulator [Francisellaceae bacterium]